MWERISSPDILSDSVIETNSINSFKSNLDKIWCNAEVKYN